MAAFRGRLDFCSNFYPAPTEYDGAVYPTSEHAFQAAKTLDKAQRKAILEAKTPGLSKKLGRKVTLRDNWNNIRCDVMYEIQVDKYNRNPELAQRLIATRYEPLVEVNEWGDQFWGQCPVGEGENNLGKILMQLREELRGGMFERIAEETTVINERLNDGH